MSEPDVYTIAVDDVPETPEEIFGPRPAFGRRSAADASGSRNGANTGSTRVQRVRMSSRRPGRVPAASTLSLLMCGAGQIFNGQFKLGILLLLIEVFFVIGHMALITSWTSLLAVAGSAETGEAKLLMVLASIDFLMVLFIPAVVYQAYRRADTENGGFEGMRNAILPGLASLMLPGWGQLLNAQVGKAVFFLFSLLSAVWVAGFLVYTPILTALSSAMGEAATQQAISGGVGIMIAAALMWILSIYDAVLVGSIRRHT